VSHSSQFGEHEKSKARQINKYERLKERYERKEKEQRALDTNTINKWVKNLSSKDLSDADKKLLGRGINFAVTPLKMPASELIACVELACKQIGPQSAQAEEIRRETSKVITHAKLPTSNITAEERLSLKSLREDKSIIILPADKGRMTVVMDTEDYISKANAL
jgi:hypothetical protein